MSLFTSIETIWSQIKLLFSKMPEDLKMAIHIGVIVTENIKNFVDSPITDVLTALIPGTIDDSIKTVLRIALPKILTDLKLADTCSELTNPAEITACAINVLQSINGDLKSALLHDLSILIAQVAADGKLSWSDGALIIEWYYQHEFKTS